MVAVARDVVERTGRNMRFLEMLGVWHLSVESFWDFSHSGKLKVFVSLLLNTLT